MSNKFICVHRLSTPEGFIGFYKSEYNAYPHLFKIRHIAYNNRLISVTLHALHGISQAWIEILPEVAYEPDACPDYQELCAVAWELLPMHCGGA